MEGGFKMKDVTRILAIMVVCFILGSITPVRAQNTTTPGTQNTQRAVDNDNDGFDWGLLGLLGLGGLAGLSRKDDKRTVHTRTDTPNR